MNQSQILEKLKKQNAIVTQDHFVYTSGKHGSSYVNKDAIYPDTFLTRDLTRLMAEPFQNEPVDAVVAPVIGGVILSQWVAFHLSQMKNKTVLAVYAEKALDNQGFVIQRGYDDLIRNKNVLIVEDILNTGGSVKKVVDQVRKLSCNIVGLSCICNRGDVKASDIGITQAPFALINITLETFEPQHCPLCKNGLPINTKLGKAKK